MSEIPAGNLRDWWAQSTKDKFVEKTNCIIQQYGNYTANQIGMQLNGITTQGENIADNGGLKEAYYGYGEISKFKKSELLVIPSTMAIFE